LKDLKPELTKKKQQFRYRKRRISKSPQQVEMQIDGKNIISFCSNDYLGFANHPKVKQTTIDAIRHYGVGSGSAHLVNGHSAAVQHTWSMAILTPIINLKKNWLNSAVTQEHCYFPPVTWQI